MSTINVTNLKHASSGSNNIVLDSSNNVTTANNLTAGGNFTSTGTIGCTGNLTVTNGNVVLSNGNGIDFSATANSSGTMTSELFDDYEEGTWTPNIGGNATYSNQVGRYIKIGNQVYATFALGISTQGTGSTISQISGLPFASGVASQNCSNLTWSGFGVAMTYGVYYLGAGGTTLSLSYTTTAQTSTSNNPNSLVNGSQVQGSIVYTV